MASSKRLENTLRNMPLNESMWLDVPMYDLFVERESPDKWTFQFGIERFVGPIMIYHNDESDDDDDTQEVDINLPKNIIHSQLSSKMKCYNFKDAVKTLDTLVNQKDCLKCHKPYSCYSPHDKLCGFCYMTIETYELKDKCVVCLKGAEELNDSLVKLCEKCSNPVCLECYNKIGTNNRHGTNCRCCTTHLIACPCCRDRNTFGKYLIIENDKHKDTNKKMEELPITNLSK
jgi:hypothetical protein